MSVITNSELPEFDSKSNKFNWGAFGFGWIWGLSHGCLKKVLALDILGMFLTFIPIIGWIGTLCIKIYFGKNGNEWAYKGRAWYNVEDFQNTQKRWATLTLTFFILISSTIGYLTYDNYNYYKRLSLTNDRLEFAQLQSVVDDIIAGEKLYGKFKNENLLVDYLIETIQNEEREHYSASMHYLTRKYSNNGYYRTFINSNENPKNYKKKIYILEKEENCSLENENCKIYYYDNETSVEKSEPRMVVSYNQNGQVKKIKNN